MKYHSIQDTPLKFHTFYRFVSMPIGAITGLIAVISSIAAMDNLFYLLDIFFCAVQMVACGAAFIGFFNWKSYAWYAVMVNLLNNVVYNVVLFAVHVAFGSGNFSYDIGTILGTGISSALIYIYYNKRKPLFFRSTNSWSSSGSFCPNCGEAVGASGSFCPNCGQSLY